MFFNIYFSHTKHLFCVVICHCFIITANHGLLNALLDCDQISSDLEDAECALVDKLWTINTHNIVKGYFSCLISIF